MNGFIRGIALATALGLAATAAAREPDRELAAALDEIVRTSALAGARAGILVTRLDSGEVVYAHDPDALLNPASNVKLFTAAAALSRLGPDYRFETEFWLDGPPSSTARTLYVRGKGDPSIVTERLYAIAAELQHAGLRSVREIVIDDTWFDAEREGPGYGEEKGDRSYLAPTGAVSLDYNAIAIHVAPGERVRGRARVEVEPDSDHVVIDNRATTGKRGSRRRVRFASYMQAGRQHVRVEGRLPLNGRPQVAWRKIDDPPAYFGYTLRRLLEQRGVKVSGAVRLGGVPAGARLLHVAESETLGEIAQRLNKHSNNFTAEQLVKALGAQVKGPPGSWPKGIAAIEEFLAEAGIARGSYVMRNGSGLNDANRFSARQTVTLLRYAWRHFPMMAEFVASLPVAGRDGTIRRRMAGSAAAGMLRAKTGTLEGVTSLSGYVETASGERLAFAVLANNCVSRRGVVRAIDAFGGALAAAGHPAELQAAVALATLPAPAGSDEPVAALEAQVASEGQLAGAGARGDPPILGSLAELAADGSDEAALRLVELAPAVAREVASSAAYAQVVAELAADAPDRLLAALRAAPAAAEDAAVSALARGLALEPADADPADSEAAGAFRAAVARAAQSGGEGAPYARALAGRLAERTAAERALRTTPPRSVIGPAPAVLVPQLVPR